MSVKRNRKPESNAHFISEMIRAQFDINPNYDDTAFKRQLTDARDILRGMGFRVSFTPSTGIPGVPVGKDNPASFVHVNVEGTTETYDKKKNPPPNYTVKSGFDISLDGGVFFGGAAVANGITEQGKYSAAHLLGLAMGEAMHMQSKKNTAGSFPDPIKGSLSRQFESAVYTQLTDPNKRDPERARYKIPIDKTVAKHLGYAPGVNPQTAAAASITVWSGETVPPGIVIPATDSTFGYSADVFDIQPGARRYAGDGRFVFAGKLGKIWKPFKQVVHRQAYSDAPQERSMVTTVAGGSAFSAPTRGVVIIPKEAGLWWGSGAGVRNTDIEHPARYDVRRKIISASLDDIVGNDVFAKLIGDVARGRVTNRSSTYGYTISGDTMGWDMRKAEDGESIFMSTKISGSANAHAAFNLAMSEWREENPDASVPNITFEESGSSAGGDGVSITGFFKEARPESENPHWKYGASKAMMQPGSFARILGNEQLHGASGLLQGENLKATGPMAVESVSAGLGAIRRKLIAGGATNNYANGVIRELLSGFGIESYGKDEPHFSVKTEEQMTGIKHLFTAMYGVGEKFGGDQAATEAFAGKRLVSRARELTQFAGFAGQTRTVVNANASGYVEGKGLTDSQIHPYIARGGANIDYSGIEPIGIKPPKPFYGEVAHVRRRDNRGRFMRPVKVITEEFMKWEKDYPYQMRRYERAKAERQARVRADVERKRKAMNRLMNAKIKAGHKVPENFSMSKGTKIIMKTRPDGSIYATVSRETTALHIPMNVQERQAYRPNVAGVKKGISAITLDQIESRAPGVGRMLVERSLNQDQAGIQFGQNSMIAATIQQRDVSGGGVMYGKALRGAQLVSVGNELTENDGVRLNDYAAARIQQAEDVAREEFISRNPDIPEETATPAKMVVDNMVKEFGQNTQLNLSIPAAEWEEDTGRVDKHGNAIMETVSAPKKDIVFPTLEAMSRAFGEQPGVLSTFVSLLDSASSGDESQLGRQHRAAESIQRAIEKQILTKEGLVSKEALKVATAAYPGGVMGGFHQLDRSLKPDEMAVSKGWLRETWESQRQFNGKDFTFGSYLDSVKRGQAVFFADRAPQQQAENGAFLRLRYDPSLKGVETRIPQAMLTRETADTDGDTFAGVVMPMNQVDGKLYMMNSVRSALEKQERDGNKWLGERHPEAVTGYEDGATWELTGDLSEAYGDIGDLLPGITEGLIKGKETEPITMRRAVAAVNAEADKERMKKNYRIPILATAMASQFPDLFGPHLSAEEVSGVGMELSKAYQLAIDKEKSPVNDYLDIMSRSIMRDGKILTKAKGGNYKDAYMPTMGAIAKMVAGGAVSPEHAEQLLRFSGGKNEGALEVLRKMRDSGNAAKHVASLATAVNGFGDSSFGESLHSRLLDFAKQLKFESDGLETATAAGTLGATVATDPKTAMAHFEGQNARGEFSPMAALLGGLLPIQPESARDRARDVEFKREQKVSGELERIEKDMSAADINGEFAAASDEQVPIFNDVQVPAKKQQRQLVASDVSVPEASDEVPPMPGIPGGFGGNNGGGGPTDTTGPAPQKQPDNGDGGGQRVNEAVGDFAKVIKMVVDADQRGRREYSEAKKKEGFAQKHPLESIMESLNARVDEPQQIMQSFADSVATLGSLSGTTDPRIRQVSSAVKRNSSAYNRNVSRLREQEGALDFTIEQLTTNAHEKIMHGIETGRFDSNMTLEKFFSLPENAEDAVKYRAAKDVRKLVAEQLDTYTSPEAIKSVAQSIWGVEQFENDIVSATISDADKQYVGEYLEKERRRELLQPYKDAKSEAKAVERAKKALAKRVQKIHRLPQGMDDAIGLVEKADGAFSDSDFLAAGEQGGIGRSKYLSRAKRILSSASQGAGTLRRMRDANLDAVALGVAVPFDEADKINQSLEMYDSQLLSLRNREIIEARGVAGMTDDERSIIDVDSKDVVRQRRAAGKRVKKFAKKFAGEISNVKTISEKMDISSVDRLSATLEDMANNPESYTESEVKEARRQAAAFNPVTKPLAKFGQAVATINSDLSELAANPSLYSSGEHAAHNRIVSEWQQNGAAIQDRVEASMRIVEASTAAKAARASFDASTGVGGTLKRKEREAAIRAALKFLAGSELGVSGATRQAVSSGGKIDQLTAATQKMTDELDTAAKSMNPFAKATKEYIARVEETSRIHKAYASELEESRKIIAAQNSVFQGEADLAKGLSGKKGTRSRLEEFAQTAGRGDIIDSLKMQDDLDKRLDRARATQKKRDNFLRDMKLRSIIEDEPEPSADEKINIMRKKRSSLAQGGLGPLGFALFNMQRINRWTFGAATSWGKQYAGEQQTLSQIMFEKDGQPVSTDAANQFYELRAAPSRLKSRLGEVWMERYGDRYINMTTGMANRSDGQLGAITDAAMIGGGVMMSQLALSTIGTMTGTGIGALGPLSLAGGIAGWVGRKGISYMMGASETFAHGYIPNADGTGGGLMGVGAAAARKVGGIGVGSTTIGALASTYALPLTAIAVAGLGAYEAYKGLQEKKAGEERFSKELGTRTRSSYEQGLIDQISKITGDEGSALKAFNTYMEGRNKATAGAFSGKKSFAEKFGRAFQASFLYQGGAIDAGNELIFEDVYSDYSKENVASYMKDKGIDSKAISAVTSIFDPMSQKEMKDLLSESSERFQMQEKIFGWSEKNQLDYGEGLSLYLAYQKLSGSEASYDQFSEMAQVGRDYVGGVNEFIKTKSGIADKFGYIQGTSQYASVYNGIGNVTATDAPRMSLASQLMSQWAIRDNSPLSERNALYQNYANRLLFNTPQEIILEDNNARAMSAPYSAVGISQDNKTLGGTLSIFNGMNETEQNRFASHSGGGYSVSRATGELSTDARVTNTLDVYALSDPSGYAQSIGGLPSKSVMDIRKRTGRSIFSEDEATDLLIKHAGVAGFGLQLGISDKDILKSVDESFSTSDKYGIQMFQRYAGSIAGARGWSDKEKAKAAELIKSKKYSAFAKQNFVAAMTGLSLQSESLLARPDIREIASDMADYQATLGQGYDERLLSGFQPAYDSMGNNYNEYHEWSFAGRQHEALYKYHTDMQKLGLYSQRAQGAYGIYKSEWNIRNLQREYHASSRGRNIWDINASRKAIQSDTSMSGDVKDAQMKSLDAEQQTLGLAQQEYQIRREMWQMSIGFQRQGLEIQKRSLALQMEQHKYQREYALEEKKAERGMKMREREWAHEDFDIQSNRFEVKASWNLEDINRNIRYSFGRKRLDLLRQRRRMQTEQNWSREDRSRQLGRRDERESFEDERWEKYLGYEAKMEEFAQRRFALSGEQLALQEAQLNAQVAAQKKLNDIADQRFKDTVTFHQGEIGHLQAILDIDKKRQDMLEKSFLSLLDAIDLKVSEIMKKLKGNGDAGDEGGDDDSDDGGNADPLKKKKKKTTSSPHTYSPTPPPGTGNIGGASLGGGVALGNNGQTKVILNLVLDGEQFGTTSFFIDAYRAVQEVEASI